MGWRTFVHYRRVQLTGKRASGRLAYLEQAKLLQASQKRSCIYENAEVHRSARPYYDVVSLNENGIHQTRHSQVYVHHPT